MHCALLHLTCRSTTFSRLFDTGCMHDCQNCFLFNHRKLFKSCAAISCHRNCPALCLVNRDGAAEALCILQSVIVIMLWRVGLVWRISATGTLPSPSYQGVDSTTILNLLILLPIARPKIGSQGCSTLCMCRWCRTQTDQSPLWSRMVFLP